MKKLSLNDFSQEVRKELVLASETIPEFNQEIFLILANPKLAAWQVYSLALEFSYGLTVEQYHFLEKAEKFYRENSKNEYGGFFNTRKKIISAFKEGLTIEQFDFVLRAPFETSQVKEIIEAYQKKLTTSEMNLLIHFGFSGTTIAFLRDNIEKVTRSQISFLTNLDFKNIHPNCELVIVKSVILNNFSKEQVFLLMRGAKLPNAELSEISQAIKNHLPYDLIKAYIDTYTYFSNAKNNKSYISFKTIELAYTLGMDSNEIISYLSAHQFRELKMQVDSLKTEAENRKINAKFVELLKRMYL